MSRQSIESFLVQGENLFLGFTLFIKKSYSLTSGPGSLAKALGITKEFSGISLLSNIVWIEDQNLFIKNKNIIASPRIGVAYAKEDANNPWRFKINNNPWTSPAKL